MADHEFGHHTNWWDTSSRASAATNTMGSFGWSSMESVSVSGSSVILQGSDTTGGGLVDPNLHMMGLGLSSQAMDWNQALQRGEKSEGGFRSMLEDQNGSFQFSSSMDSSGVYGAPGTLLQGLFGSDQQHQNNQHHQSQQQQPHSFITSRPMNTNNNYQYNNPANYGMNSGTNDWSKVPQFLRTSPPHSPFQFSNNAPFWNASAAAMPDVRPSFFPSSQTQFPTLNFDDHKPTKINDTFGQRGDMGSKSTVVAKKSSEPASKRPRKESSSPLPAFKVRKEKMGDRITALQQLVSPFGKTDTASVLSEAIEYIKFLHEQVNVLSTPYMKSGAPIQHQQNLDKSNKDLEGPKQDLRSRGLCLVPVSSTFPVAHETAVDFWNPTFGGTFR